MRRSPHYIAAVITAATWSAISTSGAAPTPEASQEHKPIARVTVRTVNYPERTQWTEARLERTMNALTTDGKFKIDYTEEETFCSLDDNRLPTSPPVTIHEAKWVGVMPPANRDPIWDFLQSLRRPHTEFCKSRIEALTRNGIPEKEAWMTAEREWERRLEDQRIEGRAQPSASSEVVYQDGKTEMFDLRDEGSLAVVAKFLDGIRKLAEADQDHFIGTPAATRAEIRNQSAMREARKYEEQRAKRIEDDRRATERQREKPKDRSR